MVLPDDPDGSGRPKNPNSLDRPDDPNKPDGPYLPVVLVKHDPTQLDSSRSLAWLGTTRLSSPLDPSWSSGSSKQCGLSGLTDLFDLSKPSNLYMSSSHPVRLGHRVRPIRLGCWAYSTRSICLDRMTSLVCHGCRVCRVCLGLSPKCEIDEKNFKFHLFLGHLNLF